MRRLAVLLGALAVPVVPVAVAAPASAVDHVICVVPATGACDQTFSTIAQAISAAGANSVDDTIQLGATTYNDASYPPLDGSTHAVTLKGAGQGSTTITMPAGGPQTYVSATQATVRDLTIAMTTTSSSGDYGLVLGSGAVADHVTVDGSGTTGAIAIYTSLSTVTHSVAVTTPTAAAGGRGIYSSGGNTISDTTISGSQALDLSNPGSVDDVSRVHIRSDYNAVVTDGGTINLDDAVIDLGTADNAVGLAAVNFNNSTSAKTITADHVTIVGTGSTTIGAWAYAAAPGAIQTSTLTLTNSIVWGPTRSLVADAGNDGGQGGPSTATLSVSHTDFQTKDGTVANGTGAGGVIEGAGNLVGVDPGFVGAGDRHLATGSPVVDKGSPAVGGPTTDLDGLARVVDGDGNGSAIRDLGAYERQDSTAPDTTISSGPAGLTRDATPTFAFTSEAGATFECRVDGAAFAPCTSPFTAATLTDGAHAFSVRAADVATNTDATPATRAFTVDTLAPQTTLTKKPAKRVTKRRVKIAFAASEAGSTFECQVDGKAWKRCTSPRRLTLKVGKHVLLVRSTDAAGNVDPTPAKVTVRRVEVTTR